MHPRDRLKKLAAINKKLKFIKQVPVHPRDRLKRKTKILNKFQLILEINLKKPHQT